LKLGRYEIIRELGKGAMGVVYLAKDPLIGRLVALKTIRLGSQVDEEEVHEFQERFVREAQAAGILSHPSIVTVHDIGRDDGSGNSFIAMEYVEGRTLKEILTQGRPFSPTDAAEVLSQIAGALAFAHRKGIVHRDVKPANIIICEENQAKITDFGIAKIASSVANLTMTGQFLGTPNYMSPEQVKGAPVDGRSDIFSLGIVLYEALTRQKPFGGDSLTTISYRIVHDTYTPASRTDPRIPVAFDSVIARCLEKLPADRYQTATELASDLRGILDGTHTEETPAVIGSSDVDPGEGTMVDSKGRVPTVEVPFPDADDEGTDPEEIDTAPRNGAPEEDPFPMGGVLPWWKRNVPVGAAATIIGSLLLVLVLAMAAIWSQRVEVPPVDTEREALVAKQRELRTEGRRLLEQGNVEGAYDAYFELRGLAPDSPAVGRTLRNLETIRAMRMSYAQRQAEARQHFEEGRSLYEQRRYSQAIPFFEQAFHLDDSLASAVSYLQMSREQMTLAQMRQRPTPGAVEPVRPGETLSPAQEDQVASNEQQEPVTLLTVFNSPVTDGYVVVTVRGETIIHEDLYEVKWGFLGRRSPRQLSEYRRIAPGPSEIEVWVVVPSLNMQERRRIEAVLEAGKLHRLTVTLNASRKTLDLQLR
jgi:serine/threonine protein kinase